jgi:hypothetical protein
MTSVVLNKLWLNRMDTGEAISGATDRDRTQGFSIDLAVRTYANGRRRAISTAGLIGELPFRLLAIDLATKENLTTWLGIQVQARDHRGQKWFGVFGNLAVTEYMLPTLYAAAFTIQTTTTVEGV